MKRFLLPISVGLVVLIAAALGVWYFLAAPKELATREPGSISGHTTYPSDGIPPLRVCAEDVSTGTTVKCVDTLEQSDPKGPLPVFRIVLMPGRYFVYATLIDPAALGLEDAGTAYYSEFVRCGMKYECKDHTRIPIDVGSGQDVVDIIPGDWYQ